MKGDLKLISMYESQTEELNCLWYPYIPLGKLTIVQGDPGEGTTILVLAVIAALTTGEPLPEYGSAAAAISSWCPWTTTTPAIASSPAKNARLPESLTPKHVEK